MKKKREEKSFMIVLAVVVGVVASILTVAITGNFMGVSKPKVADTIYASKIAETTYSKGEVDKKLSTIPTYDSFLQVMSTCKTTGKIKIGATQIDNKVVGDTSDMDTCKEICGPTKKCLIGFVGEEDKATEKHSLFGSINCDGSEGTFKKFPNSYEVECICCGPLETERSVPEPKTPEPQPVILKEQVKCVFSGSTSMQECYSEKGRCKGVGACVASISGKKGEQVTWKSSCGGYAYTMMDSQNDYAQFKCMETQQATTPIESSSEIEPSPRL